MDRFSEATENRTTGILTQTPEVTVRGNSCLLVWGAYEIENSEYRSKAEAITFLVKENPSTVDSIVTATCNYLPVLSYFEYLLAEHGQKLEGDATGVILDNKLSTLPSDTANQSNGVLHENQQIDGEHLSRSSKMRGMKLGTAERVTEFHRLLKAGYSYRQAKKMANCDPDTYLKWCKKVTNEEPIAPYR